MEGWLKILLIILTSYLIGSFPTAVIISRRFFGFDIREKGSGNMGSTNAFRILGWKWGIVVQIIDVLKGLIPIVVIAELIGQDINNNLLTFLGNITIIKFIAGASAVCGHIWSVFVKFRGGKGINTAAGILLGLAPVDVGVAIGIFALAVLISGYISLGSMVAAFTFPSSLFVRYNFFHVDIPGYHILIYFAAIMAVLLVFTHRKNIVRLVKGTENKFSKLQIIKFGNSSDK